MTAPVSSWSGALLIDKPDGVSSFGVIEELQHALKRATGLKRKDLPKLGHGGTLDPFATGLLVVCVGRAAKLARYFLGSTKVYEGLIRFGETTIPGDPTDPVSERSEHLPGSLEEIQTTATKLTAQPYLQTPPMHSAKKHDGKPLYELAREGIEVEREPKVCQLYEFAILDYTPPRAAFRVTCSSGTYIRTLAQDSARILGTVGMLDTLRRTDSGALSIAQALPLESVLQATEAGTSWETLPAWIPFDQMLSGFASVVTTHEEMHAVLQGRQNVLIELVRRSQPPRCHVASSAQGTLPGDPPRYPVSQERCLAVFSPDEKLIAVARNEAGLWSSERVFPP
jgi:tRNA pseudouridine55 synthase